MRLLAWSYLIEHSFAAEESAAAELAVHIMTTVTGVYVTLATIHVFISCLTLLAALRLPQMGAFHLSSSYNYYNGVLF